MISFSKQMFGMNPKPQNAEVLLRLLDALREPGGIIGIQEVQDNVASGFGGKSLGFRV